MWKLHASGHMLLFSFPHRKHLKRTHYTFPRSCKLPQGLPSPHFHTRNYCRPGNSTWDHSIPNHNMQHAHSNMPQKLVCNWQNSNEDINNSETNLFSILLPKLLSVSINEKKKTNNGYKIELGYLILWVSQKTNIPIFFQWYRKLLSNLENHMKISRKKKNRILKLFRIINFFLRYKKSQICFWKFPLYTK